MVCNACVVRLSCMKQAEGDSYSRDELMTDFPNLATL